MLVAFGVRFLLYKVPRFRGVRRVSRRRLWARPPCSSQVPEARVPLRTGDQGPCSRRNLAALPGCSRGR